MASTLPESLFRHAALRPGPKAVSARERAFRELRQLGVAPAPALVSDLVTCLVEGRCESATDPQRPTASHVTRCMSMVASAANAVHGAPTGQEAIRTRGAIRFLVTWFAAAPRVAETDAALARLEREAMGMVAAGNDDPNPWRAWRDSEERGFEREGSPAFRQALAELRMGSPAAFGATDERIWFLEGGEGVVPRVLDVTSSRREGLEGEPTRDPSGVFREIACHGLPPNPERICSADLAIIASRSRGARALLASKLAESSLMVRFGSVPRPSLRRPRVLLVVALLDSIDMHEQRAGSVVPDIEPLRESLLRAIPSCVRSFERTDVDFEIEIRREGPLARGRMRLSETRNRHRRVRTEFRFVELLRDRLASKATWLFQDFPVASTRHAPPEISGHDATYLLAVAGSDDLAGLAWTRTAVVRPTGDGSYRLQAQGGGGPVDRAVDIGDAPGLAIALSACISPAPDRIDQPRAESPAEEGVSLP